MQSPFLIARIVFFVILGYLNILALAITIWLLHSLNEKGSTAVGPSIFSLVNSSGLLFMELVATTDYWIPLARTGQVKFELGWTFVLSILQITAAFDVMFNGPPVYCSVEGWTGVCTVYTLLTALTWSSSIILFSYFLALACTACAHRLDYPTLWVVTIRQVPWFTERRPGSPAELQLPKIVVTGAPYENPVFRSDDEEKGHSIEDANHFNSPVSPRSEGASSDSSRLALRVPPSPISSRASFRPSWAKRIMTRRGIDPPFVPNPTPPTPPPWERPYSSNEMLSYTDQPPVPPKAHLPVPSGLSGGSLGIPAHGQRMSYSHFPAEFWNPDQSVGNSSPPSEWIRADGLPRYI
ncbi:hypothetical protein EIP86_004222 [Pleurotus ostreatoroseus]|nr:hypothetical protein EIP86_004222 [Pleurotus ostreatoroseus]